MISEAIFNFLLELVLYTTDAFTMCLSDKYLFGTLFSTQHNEAALELVFFKKFHRFEKLLFFTPQEILTS